MLSYLGTFKFKVEIRMVNITLKTNKIGKDGQIQLFLLKIHIFQLNFLLVLFTICLISILK